MSENTLKLSIVIPIYNAEKTLLACVQSILHQANRCIEIILVDDGSTDTSAALCSALSENKPDFIRVIHQHNSGSLMARITGAVVAKGEYLLFVDADDVLVDGAIPQILKDISGGADLYMYDYIMDGMGGNTSSTVRVLDIAHTTEFFGESKKLVSQTFMKGMMNTVCATAIRRSFMEGLDLYIPEKKICHGEDRLHKLQLIANAERIVYVPCTVYHYKWYPSTQGAELRVGDFSAEIYENFRLTWPIEREHYLALGFDKDQSCIYDRKKLARICSLFENAWCKNKLTSDETSALICQLSYDELFLKLSSKELLAGVRPHIRLVAALIRGNHRMVLKAYWWMCRLIRKYRYGAKTLN